MGHDCATMQVGFKNLQVNLLIKSSTLKAQICMDRFEELLGERLVSRIRIILSKDLRVSPVKVPGEKQRNKVKRNVSGSCGSGQRVKEEEDWLVRVRIAHVDWMLFLLGKSQARMGTTGNPKTLIAFENRAESLKISPVPPMLKTCQPLAKSPTTVTQLVTRLT
ncbi:unnamed protein product [Arabis nemorensis]|uniref:Uncharacterized protein n=1 Tax=Arabis nemorensis TaxID=586526 RepID=A0A565BKN1_9BRAS|nr:unnamed protein product [Arabis nemorensis]